MDSISIACSIVIALGAGMLVACIIQIGEVRHTVGLVLEPDRSWLLARVRLHRALMVLFLVAYAAVAGSCLTGFDEMNAAIVPAVFFLVSAFVYIGILMQNRMSAAMLRTIHGLIPLCAWCKRVRTTSSGQSDEPEWQSVETFLARRAPVDFSHGICPDCLRRMRTGTEEDLRREVWEPRRVPEEPEGSAGGAPPG